MNDFAVAFCLGCLWFSMTGVQTRLLVKTKSETFLMAWAFVTSVVWGYLIRVVVLSPAVVLPYALGTALGAWIARRISRRWLE
jgi:uncharacterized membrane protein YfcA